MGTLNMVARSVNGTLIGADRCFDSVSTDTRQLQSGQLFFALRGERFDAREFVAEAERRGAAGAVVEARQAVDLPQVEVEDTRIALGGLARNWRQQFEIPVIAVTGSTGKTTVKEMIAAILRVHFSGVDKALATVGNLNNEIGLPLTVLCLRDSHAAAVLEMGASRRNDIATLAAIAKPTIGVVTNAGAAHLEGFGSEQAVAETKGELFASLDAAGIAVINRDDRFFELWRRLAEPAQVISFGLNEAADLVAEKIEETVSGAGFELSFDVREANDRIRIKLPMVGRHNVLNALGAIAVTRVAGATWDSIGAGLAAIENVAGRLRIIAGRGGMRIIDDTYNANPLSVAAAIAVLAGLDGRSWLVLGDMAELGTRSQELHAEAGRQAKRAGVERLYTLGKHARAAVGTFGEGGQAFAEEGELLAVLGEVVEQGLTVLIKGSRCMQMEKLVQALVDAAESRGVRA
ncbi:MAG: UDP-N-acetylmuramoyl-tripeptide--D-alanyl-D-alanine ligase [Gammaproteobacteria bacterium]|jgi:UDP-N-acetylmuramoyl-tripeptide--D-alanyl-D-alanine ligase|nr:UDP-N-acetylmuramoyl-tripeptide--D-alanyl-D-alanine ligase [Gammaproteobacteria bacterium]MDP7295908.1 UDP-N-acetylmuramoyl-tripeptide--D-alanyl-D-alanine ligase [Gammaproteobacteria bacterium]